MSPVDPVLSRASFGIVKKGLTTLLKPSSLDRLVARVRDHPNAPPLDRKLRARLIRLIQTETALDALFDQDVDGEATLSTLIAEHVFRARESADSTALAQILITEFPGALDTPETFNLVAYSIRQL